MADNRPPRRAEEIMDDEEGWSGGPVKRLCRPARSGIPTRRPLSNSSPTRRAIKSHNHDKKWHYLN